METTTVHLDRAIDGELRLVEGAIRYVAADPRVAVVVGGLRFGEAVLALAGRDAAERELTLEPLWRLDEHGCDIRVRARRADR